jgi:serine/threonine protein kinase/tetratricopeptide (TPR) repeat protein
MSGSASGEDPLGQLADEFVERWRRGERPALTEYTDRHPELAGQIRELFPALVMMEDIRPGPPAVVGAVARSAAGSPWGLGEYRIVREIGRGGMGVVYEAEQLSLGRRVALKVLPPGALGDARQVERFQREARAAARLHHTNIVPVFAVGEEGGTHYYVMQYIEGRPLDQVLTELRRLRAEAERGAAAAEEKDFSVGLPSSAAVARSLWHGQSRAPAPGGDSGSPGPDPTDVERTVVRPRGPLAVGPAGAGSEEAGSSGLLTDPQRPFARRVAQIGVQVAEALEYAAGQGVLHRDVKPSNLLLDVWGTVWLTDFGLAKATGAPDLTRPGDLLGTLRYLAPERFDGRADVRSDVYALGLTLYELLALRPAFDEHDEAELARHITTTEPPRLDRLNPQLPRDLVTIVHKAMAKEPADRYQTARALAEDLRRFLDDRSIVARRVGLLEQAWRWCRRNPSSAALVAALLALVLMATGAGVWFERQQAARRDQARAAIAAALWQVPGLRQQGRWTEARALLTQARNRQDDAGADDLRRLSRAEEDVEVAATLEQIRLTPAVADGDFDYRAMAGAYARAFERAGLDVWGDEERVAARIHDAEVRPELVTALDHWALVADALGDGRLRARLLRLARRADPDPDWGDRFRDPELWENVGWLRCVALDAQERLAGGAPGAGPPTPLLTLLGRKLGQKEDAAEPLLRAAQRRHPEDFWLNYALGEALRERKPAEAVGFYRAALATRPTVAAAHAEIGMALFRQDQGDEAILAYRRAIELDPKAVRFHIHLGVGLLHVGRMDEAMAEFRLAIGDNPTWSALAHQNLAMCLQDRGQLDEAVQEFRQVLALANRADSHLGLGMCLRRQGEFDAALAEHCHALELNPRLATSHYELGQILQARGRTEEAIAAFRRTMDLEPKWAPGHAVLADALLRQGRFPEARRAARRGLDVLPAREPGRADVRQKLEQAEQLIALDARLPAFLQGQGLPADAGECLNLARQCRDHGRPRAAARLYAAAFAARPALADDLGSGNRYAAACAAARAADPDTGGASPGESERAALRRQALDWLRADLAQRTKLLQGGQPGAWGLPNWQTDAALAGVRDGAPLALLPDDERRQWRRLWVDVAALLAADPREQGRIHAARREWAQAANSYARALERGPTEDGELWFEYAAVLLLSGDRPGYMRACARLVEQCGKAQDPRPYLVARACTLAPDAVADAAAPERLARKELTTFGKEFWAMTERGALLCRAGRPNQAVPLLEQSLHADPRSGSAVLSWVWLALANQRLGRAEEARRWLGKAQTLLDRYDDGLPGRANEEMGLHLHNWLEAHALRREAEALLGAGPRAPDPTVLPEK